MASILALIMYNIICHDLKTNDFTRTCRDGVVATVFFLVAIQFFVLIFSKESLLTLIRYMKNDFEMSSPLSPEEQMIIKKYAGKGLYVCKQWFVVAVVATLGFIMKSIFLTSYYYYIDEFQLVAFYEFFYPELIATYMDNPLGYCLRYVYLCTYSTYATTTFMAYCPLGPMFMLHACGQLEIVKMRLHNLFVDHDDQVIQDKLKSIIERLQYIYNFVKIIDDIFKIPYELMLKATTILLPITFYEVIEAAKRREVSLEFISFIIGGTLISSSPCYFSDLLKEKGDDVRQAIYTCGWEEQYDQCTRNTILILLLNALRPIALKTVFKTLCLEALAEVFRESYAIFNLMNAMWK